MLQRLPTRKVCRHVPVTDAHLAAPGPRNHSHVFGEELCALYRQRILVRRTQGTADQAPGQLGGRHVEDTQAKTHSYVQFRENQKYGGTPTGVRQAARRLHAGTPKKTVNYDNTIAITFI